MSERPARSGQADILTDVVAQREAADRRAALRALLREPLMTATHPAFPLVRRHREELVRWMSEQAGWTLTVGTEHARLRKTPGGTVDHTRPATSPRTGRPFSRRRYVLWCLALAALERSDSQVTLGWLAERILDLAADPALTASGATFTLQTRAERTDLVEVVRMLIGTGGLSRVAGDEDAYLKETGDALYDIDRRVLASILPGTQGPSTIPEGHWQERLAALSGAAAVDDLAVPGTEARTRDARRRLTRRLLDDPVVYHDDVADNERDYLALPGQRHATARRVAEATGMIPELRAEGLALLDPTGEATDLSMPAQGTQGHATLLLAEHLATNPEVGVPVVQIRRLVAEWAHTHPWSKTSRDDGAEAGIAAIAIGHLQALGLVSMTGDTVYARPAITRYTVDGPTIQGQVGQ